MSKRQKVAKNKCNTLSKGSITRRIIAWLTLIGVFMPKSTKWLSSIYFSSVGISKKFTFLVALNVVCTIYSMTSLIISRCRKPFPVWLPKLYVCLCAVVKIVFVCICARSSHHYYFTTTWRQKDHCPHALPWIPFIFFPDSLAFSTQKVLWTLDSSCHHYAHR